MEGSRSPYGIGRRVDGNPETNDLVSRGEPSLENVPLRSREDILEIDAGPSHPSPSSRSNEMGRSSIGSSDARRFAQCSFRTTTRMTWAYACGILTLREPIQMEYSPSVRVGFHYGVRVGPRTRACR